MSMWQQDKPPIWKLQNHIVPPGPGPGSGSGGGPGSGGSGIGPVKSWPPETGKYFQLYNQLRVQQQTQNQNYNPTTASRPGAYKVSQIRCINCSKIGHLYRNCTSAVTSFGIIAITKHDPAHHLKVASESDMKTDYLCPEHASYTLFENPNVDPGELLFCMVQRKDTMGYIDFIRGKYPDSNCLRKETLVTTFVQEMTCNERKRLLEMSFDDIWEKLWSHHSNRNYIKQKEYKDAKAKFMSFDLLDLFERNNNHWPTHEWGFPKGRKNISESNIDCAIREFCEETGYKREDLDLIDDIPPIVEEFKGTNGLFYKHVWYCATITDSVGTPHVDPNSHLQAGEIANVGWFTQRQCLYLFRSYETSKAKVLNKLVNKYASILASIQKHSSAS